MLMLLSNLNYDCIIVKSVGWWTLVFLPAPLMLCCYSSVCQKTGNIKPAHGCNNWDFVQQEQTKNTGRVNYSKILAFSYTLTKSTLLDNSQTKLDLDACESGLMLGLKGHTSIAAKPVLFRVAEWPCWLNIIQLLESYETLLTAVYLTVKSVWCEHFTTKNKAQIERVYFLGDWF